MERFHGIDRHKAYSTISVLNREGVEIEFHPCIKDLKAYLNSLGPEDTIVLEASTGSFWWADYIEAKGITCFILNPYRFKIIKDSWNKTDKRDARNMAKALWVYRVTGEFGLPTIYKPSIAVGELRKLFTYYNLLNRQIRMLKNGDNTVIQKLDLTLSSILIISGELDLLRNLLERKEKLTENILLAGAGFQKQVELLITIRGITPLVALAFLADIGDINRFSSTRKNLR